MRKLFILLFLFGGLLANAQYFQTGQDPASIKWRQINTENFQLIYPDYYEDQAQKLGQKMEAVYNYGSHSLDYKPKKISIILHTQTVKSNGLVAYAPRRSEFYTTPHQGIYPQDWLEQLAVHEFRHVVQIGKLNEELPKIVKILLGEQGTALAFGAYLPWWFIEGDAVVTETVLGNYGRGRFPSFLVEHRAQVVEQGKYSYDKAYLGSYKNFVPNHYQLGYYMVANTRQRYGSQIWERTIKRVGNKPLSITPFNKALKLETGYNKVQLYNSIFDSLAIEWKNQDNNFVAPAYHKISTETKRYTNYRYNHWLNESEIITYKTSFNTIPTFVKLNKNGEEKKIYQPGFIFEESVSYKKEWVVWSEQIPDLRWSHSGRSVIYLLNVTNKKKLKITPEFKAFAPAISQNLDRVVVVETDFSSNNYLSVYRINDGKLLQRIQTPENNYFFSPEWRNDEELLVVILTANGKRLASVDLKTGNSNVLFDKDLGEIKHLRFIGDKLYFISGLSGKNALYSYDLNKKQIDQLLEPRFSVEYPSVNEKGEILLSDYTGNGFRLLQVKETNKKRLNEIEVAKYLLAEELEKQEIGKPNFNIIDTLQYTSEKYHKARNLLNFHSWAPVFVDVNNYEFRPGFSIMSQNKLGTAETILGYKWDTSEKTGQFYGSYTYKGWYPEIQFELSKGKRASKYWLITEHRSNGEVLRSDTTLERFTWKETELSTSISLPLNFSHGKYFRLFQPEFEYDLTLYKNNSSTPDNFPDGTYHALSYRLYYHQLMRRSYQDVYPNFGFVLDGMYRHSPNGSSGLGNILGGQTILYTPAFHPNHGIKIYVGTQKKNRGETFRFSDFVKFPRGWGKIETKNLSTLSIDYKLPVINPDWSIGGLTYLRRINASLFTDHANLKGNYYENGEIAGTYSTNISSYGMELTGDVNFLRFYAPVKIGVRTSYLPEAEDFVFDFLFSIDFNSL